MAPHQRPLFVLFGASMTEYSFAPGGWGAALTDLYSRKADILLRGYRGWNTRRACAALEQFFPKDSPSQPALVVVFFGANDAAVPVPSGRGQYVPLQEYKENLVVIASYLKGLCKMTRVVLISAPPIYDDGRGEYIRWRYDDKVAQISDRTNERAKDYAQACIEAAKEANVEVIDLWTAIQEKENWQTKCLCDGMHLAPEGNKVLLDELLNILSTADWSPSLHWKSLPNDFAEPSVYDYVHPAWELL